MKLKLLRNTGVLFFILGFGIIINSIYIIIHGKKHNDHLIDTFNNQNLLNVENNENSNKDTNKDTNKNSYKTENINETISNNTISNDKNVVKPNNNNVIAILEIPRLNIKYAVSEGTDSKTLKYSLGHFSGTAMPGENGNFAVAGHRNSSYARYFNRLDEVKKNDEILVTTHAGKFLYKVTDKFIISKNDSSVLNSTTEKEITLITCTNGYKPKYRIIVKGTLLNPPST